jgi:mono/diheme cytochrome c family protein
MTDDKFEPELSATATRAKEMSDRSKRFPRLARAFVICHLSFVMLLAICYCTTVGAADRSETGEKIFQSRCFVCHGRDGRGSGPASQGLAQKPQDLTDPSWQRSVTDDQIKTVIRAGGAIIGKSGAMPPNPDLTNEDLNSLLEYVRHLANTR